ncbi:DUF2971 domain-containing protein [Clostridium sp. Marseille-P2415]|uniref:DUF2971 domain-containing protein n=1 Tax=Clostridium sp. Marseille-P2415 TaxID=1805471 RepID=UPI0009883120|nr:DUF2971 domain-containing protein [Clostridium sp. Marseille-P2415]
MNSRKKEFRERFIDQIATGNLEQTQQFFWDFISEIPYSLFRYRSGTGKYEDGSIYDLNALNDNTIFLGAAARQNDLNDSLVYFNAVAEIKRLGLYDKIDKETFQTIANYLDGPYSKRMQKETFIGCLSEVKPYGERYSDYMWEEYANNKSGFCIEYRYLDFAAPLFPVNYNNYFNRNVREDTIITSIITTKEEIWEKEEEWRIIKTGKGGNIEAPIPIHLYIGEFCEGNNKELYDGLMNYSKNHKQIEVIDMRSKPHS